MNRLATLVICLLMSACPVSVEPPTAAAADMAVPPDLDTYCKPKDGGPRYCLCGCADGGAEVCVGGVCLPGDLR